MASFEWREPRETSERRLAETIRFGGGRDAGSGYMSHSSRVGPGVLVLHEFFGLQESFKAYADDLSEAGFTALAVDLYDGALAHTVAEARQLAQALDLEQSMRRLRAAARHLRDNWHPRLGAVGFSLGADLAAALAEEGLVDAVVLYYGAPEGLPLRTPVLGHLAEHDEWLPLEHARRAFDALTASGVDAEAHVYPKTGHWFANAAVATAFDATAASRAQKRTFDFFHRHLS